MKNEIAELSEQEIARDAKRQFNGAIRKLRAAVASGDLTPVESRTMRESWYAGEAIPAEYLG